MRGDVDGRRSYAVSVYFRFAVRLAALALCIPGVALADALVPKVCLVAAGDVDDAVLRAVEPLRSGLERERSLRHVTDPSVALALLGRPATELAATEVAALRSRLVGDETDAIVSNELARRLGCALVVHVGATAGDGLVIRLYDAPDHVWLGPARHALGIHVVRRTAWAVSAGTAALAWGISTHVPPMSELAPVRRTLASAPRSESSTDGNDQSRGPGLAGWVVTGAAAAALIVVFAVTQSATPSGPTLVITRAGATP